MCVTNTTYRRSQPISLPQQQQKAEATLGACTAQRLMGAFALPKPEGLAVPSAICVPAEKNRPKRRRKPQKPGKTAKMNDRHFVIHNYHDHAMDPEDMFCDELHQDEHSRRKGGVAVAFPLKLHAILDQVELDGLGHVISWQPHGRCFVIHQPKEFVATVMPKYFRQTKLTSFQRQLNLYGFCRLTRGADSGGYYHELFLRGKEFLCKRMIRTKVKGTKFKAASSPDQEPDFYTMPSVTITPSHSPHASPKHQPIAYDDSSQSETISATPLPGPSSDLRSVFNSNPAPYQQQQIEPFPFQQQLQQQFQQPSISQAHLSVPAAQNPYEAAPAPPPYAGPNQADQILDEAINELFLNSSSNNMTAEMNDLDDFVRDWEPRNFSQTLDNDLALGFMLDKLLEE